LMSIESAPFKEAECNVVAEPLTVLRER